MHCEEGHAPHVPRGGYVTRRASQERLARWRCSSFRAMVDAPCKTSPISLSPSLRNLHRPLSPYLRDLHLCAHRMRHCIVVITARGHTRVCPVASPTRRVADSPPLPRSRISKACMPVRKGSEASDPYPLDSPDRTAGKRSDRARACAGVEAEPVEGRHAAG